jgi:hypothetical protein
MLVTTIKASADKHPMHPDVCIMQTCLYGKKVDSTIYKHTKRSLHLWMMPHHSVKRSGVAHAANLAGGSVATYATGAR